MMRHINWFYISIAILGVVLVNILINHNEEAISFYGSAETNETAINYNHPVMVDKIHITPGQYVNKGDVLLNVSRIASKETLQDQPYAISELLAEEAIWKAEKESEITVIKAERKLKLEALNNKLSELQKELQHRESLMEGLNTLKTDKPKYQPIKDKIQAVKKEKALLEDTYVSKLNALENQKATGNNPYREQILHLQAELAFDDDHQVQHIQVLAPSDGIIGNLHCKEAEHVTSFNPLMSFYEPHPSLIKGYVHEGLSLKVSVADSFLVRSIKDPTAVYKGVVTGLGSRIVEIPERLRKVPDFKTYGREVTVAISPENAFLQKEKVALELLYRHKPAATHAEAKK